MRGIEGEEEGSKRSRGRATTVIHCYLKHKLIIQLRDCPLAMRLFGDLWLSLFLFPALFPSISLCLSPPLSPLCLFQAAWAQLSQCCRCQPNCRDFIQFVAATATLAAAQAATNVATCCPNCFRCEIEHTHTHKVPQPQPVQNAHKKSAACPCSSAVNTMRHIPHGNTPLPPLTQHSHAHASRPSTTSAACCAPMHNCCLYEKISPNGVLHYLPPDAAVAVAATATANCCQVAEAAVSLTGNWG